MPLGSPVRYLLAIVIAACLMCGCATSHLGSDRTAKPSSPRGSQTAPAKEQRPPDQPENHPAVEVESVQASYPGGSDPDRL